MFHRNNRRSITYERIFRTIAPMDMQAALLHFDGDKTFMTELLTVFLAGLPTRLSELDGRAE